MSEVLAMIGDIAVTDADVDAFIETLPQEQQHYATNPHFRNRCKEQLIDCHCFAKMAEEMKVEESEEFKRIMERAKLNILSQLMINSVLKEVSVSEEDAMAFYQENPQHFPKGESVKAKHILVGNEEQCNEILEKILSGEMDFESAAKDFSTCPSGDRGGDLGEFGRGQMVPEFETAAFEAEIGKIVGPVKTQFGYHLIKVEEKKEASVMPYADVAESIKTNLQQQKQAEAYAAKANELRDKYMK